MDGSLLDGLALYCGLCCRLDWASVAVDTNGVVVASTHGVPPPWVKADPGRGVVGIAGGCGACDAWQRLPRRSHVGAAIIPARPQVGLRQRVSMRTHLEHKLFCGGPTAPTLTVVDASALATSTSASSFLATPRPCRPRTAWRTPRPSVWLSWRQVRLGCLRESAHASRMLPRRSRC
jgi:hypothetical protein